MLRDYISYFSVAVKKHYDKNKLKGLVELMVAEG